MLIPFEQCNSIEEIADNAAKFQRTNLEKVHDKKNTNKTFVIDKMYRFLYANNKMKLHEDITVQKEYSKKQWEENKQVGETYRQSMQTLSRYTIDDDLDHIATVSHYILKVARDMSEQTCTPVFIIYNARAATIYSNLLEDDAEILYRSDVLSKRINSHALDIEEIIKMFKAGDIKWCIIPIRDMKISSHQYVQTQEEVDKLGKKGISNLLRRSFIDKECAVNEYIPDIFIECLRNKCGVIFIDVPTWGVGYASSTGLLRKEKDIEKRKNGIFSPFKFQSYVEFAKYQVASFSMAKFCDTESHIKLLEEDLSRIDITQPVALILNPEVNKSIWWDDCPQFYEIKWKKYSDLTMFSEPLYVETNQGKMDIAEYIIKKIKGAAIVNELSLFDGQI